MAENTLSLSFRDNEEMRSFVSGMSPSVGGSISLVVTVGITEYDDNRLTGVVTNIDRDPYTDYQQPMGPQDQEFAGGTEPAIEGFDASGMPADQFAAVADEGGAEDMGPDYA